MTQKFKLFYELVVYFSYVKHVLANMQKQKRPSCWRRTTRSNSVRRYTNTIFTLLAELSYLSSLLLSHNSIFKQPKNPKVLLLILYFIRCQRILQGEQYTNTFGKLNGGQRYAGRFRMDISNIRSNRSVYLRLHDMGDLERGFRRSKQQLRRVRQ